MNIQEILLVILSGLGVFHGIFIAILFWNNKDFSTAPNRLLSLLMIILSIRIGKSVVLEFLNGLDIIYVYSGLCLLMFIGPLFYLYCKKLVHKESTIKRVEYFHFFAGAVFLLLAIPLEIIGFKNLPVMVTFGLFIVFYGHFFSYLIAVRLQFFNHKKLVPLSAELKDWLNILFYGLLSIWVAYVLNLFEERVPYIIGPVLYSIVVYTITYLVISKKFFQNINPVKYQTTNFTEAEINPLFKNIEKIVLEEHLYLNPEISLSLLSKQLKVTPQKISLAINSKSGYNFNDYINNYRIRYATQLMKKDEAKTLTIASIATDAGFNSLSTFNTAFKKFTGKTPSAYKNVAE